MELIYYRGLNCCQAAVVNIADRIGVNYLNAFATLWSETDFIDDRVYEIYTSKRFPANFEAIGVLTEQLLCGKNMIGKHFSDIPDGEYFVIGMDVFHIPWHRMYHFFHDPHFFFAQKKRESLVCYDPIYNQSDIKLSENTILPTAFEVCRIYKQEMPKNTNVLPQEAKAIIDNHPHLKESLLKEIKLSGENRKCMDRLLKYITVLINNRYLFGQYLQSIFTHQLPIFNDIFYRKWEGVKNGLYKITIKKDHSKIVDEVCDMVAELLEEEIIFAHTFMKQKDDNFKTGTNKTGR